MELVIDISEEMWERVKEGYVPLGISKYLKNATPLPKGHGRLKDVDKIISDGISKGFCDWYDEMKYAPTIIPAEGEENV